ncbi:MAG TPA: DUF1918 domain-containing protein [Streptosporangiaceae bacterium]|nr:DUF1918 domain-containing protein [Streptosporangiaceae bacterium]
MKAKAGDQLLAGSGAVGVILSALGADGHPPYIVKWQPAGNIAMVDPDPYARIVPATVPQCDGIAPVKRS